MSQLIRHVHRALLQESRSAAIQMLYQSCPQRTIALILWRAMNGANAGSAAGAGRKRTEYVFLESMRVNDVGLRLLGENAEPPKQRHCAELRFWIDICGHTVRAQPSCEFSFIEENHTDCGFC